jgi:hypothetical protein
MKQCCSYYQAKVDKEKTWFVVGTFRNEDHVAFERAIEGQTEILEFFVPQDQEDYFLILIQRLKEMGYILWFEKKDNRFCNA